MVRSKKLGNFYCSITHVEQYFTIVKPDVYEVWISLIMFSITDNFLESIQKSYHVITIMMVMGRKLPTAFNSQQLLRWLWPKRYIFPFFSVAKNRKIWHIKPTKYSGLTHNTDKIETWILTCPKVADLDTSKVQI